MNQEIILILVGLCFAIQVSIAHKDPCMITIGGAVFIGCIFLLNLVLLLKG